MTGGAPAAAQRVRPPADPFAGVKGFLDNLFSFGRPRFAPAFATALLALGGVVGWQLHRVSDAPGAAALPLVVDNGQIRAQGALASALETAPAGLVVKTSASDPAITVRLTFKSKAQAFCRQYEIDAGGGAAFAGIACRAASGHWQISYHTPMAASPTSQTQVTPVSDAKAQLGALVDAMSSGDPLDAEEEARVRKEHWR
jgi:hypothetical protein